MLVYLFDHVYHRLTMYFMTDNVRMLTALQRPESSNPTTVFRASAPSEHGTTAAKDVAATSSSVAVHQKTEPSPALP